jgi:hypothetical protein
MGLILGGSSDVALSANVAPLGDSHFDGCDLLQRGVVPYGACKALAGDAMDDAVNRGVEYLANRPDRDAFAWVRYSAS